MARRANVIGLGARDPRVEKLALPTFVESGNLSLKNLVTRWISVYTPSVTTAGEGTNTMRCAFQAIKFTFCFLILGLSVQDIAFASGPGCDYVLWGSKPQEKPIPFTLDQMRMSDGFPDVMPWNFSNHRIPEAWARSAGANIKIAVIDTGVFRTQTQLRKPNFSSPAALGVNRTVSHISSEGGSPWAPTDGTGCRHGTSMASTMAAPHDGANIVGVAWKADLVSVKAVPDVLVPDWSEKSVVQAIRLAVDKGAKIIAIAIGRHSDSSDIAKEIRDQFHYKDILFFGAAGTDYCLGSTFPFPPGPWVAFPARMEEVIAVAGIYADGTIHRASCGGPEVDLAAVIGEVPAAGARPWSIVHHGGSSDAVAIAAGVAALVWSAHPQWNRDQVRERLYSTAVVNMPELTGHGRIDAYGAVGGFTGIQNIDGPRYVRPSQPYGLTAVPQGDGPFRFQWKGGEATAHIDAVAGPAGTQQTFTVAVTDEVEGKTISQSVTVTSSAEEPPPPLCPSGQKCCNVEGDRCTRCIPNAEVCAACPVGQKCCETTPDNFCALCAPEKAACP